MRNRHGFTIIEVSFFLAITGLIFLGVTIGVQNSIYRQRYNDSVQSFVEFLRGVYAQTTNVQNIEKGRTDKAIFGKLVTFGESKNPLGENNTDKAVFTYDVIGDVDGINESGGDQLQKLLKDRHADVMVNESENGIPEWKPAGIVESFIPKWSASIQSTAGGPFQGTLLVVRHPRSGSVYTLFYNEVIEVNKSTTGNVLTSKLANFKLEDVDFCVTPDGLTGKKGRADVRINRRATGSAGIETYYDDNNKCDEE